MFSWEIYEFLKSSYKRCFTKKAVLKNFTIFKAKLQTCNFIKKNIAKFLRTTILKNICKRLLLQNSYMQNTSEQLFIYRFFYQVQIIY